MRSVLRYLTAALALLCLAEITDLAWLSGVRATITTTASKVVAAGNGSTTQWNFSFVGVSTADLIVSVTNSSGVTTVLTLNTQYTVIFTPQAPNSVWSVGGFVTYPLSGPPLALGNTLTIQRLIPYTQTTPFQNQGQFLPQAVETAVDLLTMQAQQLNTLFTGALVEPATDSQPLAPLPAAAARANNALCFDSTGYIPLPCSVLPASSFLVSGTPSPGWVPIATSSTTAVWGTTFPALMTFGTGLTGTLPWVQADVYAGGSTGTIVNAVRGTIASPITDGVPAGIFQSTSNIASGTGQTLYASVVKTGTAATDSRAIWAECNDTVGGVNSSLACGRFSGLLGGGTLGNGTAITASMSCTVSYAFCGTVEGQIFNNFTDATTTFSSASFETSFLASNSGTKKSFAALMTNPFGVTPYINGFYVAAGTVQDSVVRSDAATVYGINLLNATCSTACFRSPSYQVDGAGNVTSNSETTNALITTNLLISKTAPTIGTCGGGTPAISANNGTAAFRVTVGSATSICAIILPTAATGWNCYATDLTTNSTTVFVTKQTASATNGATLGNFNDAAAAANWATSDVLAVSCFAL